MDKRRPISSSLLLMLLLLATVTLYCSGCHAPGGPPDDGGIIGGGEFIVEAGETRNFKTDTTITVEGDVRIDGQVFGADGTSAGDDGVSITIETQGNILVRGRLVAGSGIAGTADAPGGAGGNVLLRTTGGNITIGADPQVAAAPAQTGGTELAAGDGADGGDGLTGGAGGIGGSIRLEAPNGTLTLNPCAGFLRRGDGGSGGQGVVGGQDILNFDPQTQLTSSGGDGGRLHINCADLQGVDIVESTELYQAAPVFVAWLDPGMMLGGAGGDGGDFYLGVDPDTGESTWPTDVSPTAVMPMANGTEDVELIGLRGGDSESHGGDGNDVNLDFGGVTLPGEGQDAGFIFAQGGRGGDVNVDPSGPFGDAWALVAGRDNISSGDGGDALVKAPNGGHGGPGQDGGKGGNARAEGGKAGDVNASYGEYDRSQIGFGAPGSAEAHGGNGGNGGPLCVVTAPGGNGGEGGNATAVGGTGAVRGLINETSGDALAVAGNGGDGAAGHPPGAGGEPGDPAAYGGIVPPWGEALETEGDPGENGGPCPEPEIVYEVATSAPGHSYEYQDQVRVMGGIFNGVVPRQANQALLGSTDNNPIQPLPGQTLAFTPDGSRLFIGTINQGVMIYSNPSAGGDRPPDSSLLPGTPFRPTSLYYDATRDHLYVAAGDNVFVWHNASGIAGNPQPNRVIDIGGLGAPTINCITGDPTRDILYVAAVRIYVLDNGSVLNGPSPIDRTIITADRADGSLACDSARDRLYAGGRDLITNSHRVFALDNASAVDGNIAPAAAVEVGQGDWWPAALYVFGDVDELLVGVFGRRLLLFQDASQLADGAQPDAEMGINLTALGVRRQ